MTKQHVITPTSQELAAKTVLVVMLDHLYTVTHDSCELGYRLMNGSYVVLYRCMYIAGSESYMKLKRELTPPP
jgi:hypothetical protein